MTYIVHDACVKCKYKDCVEVCPVDCFYEGENMLVIDPDACIDCGVCEPECPADAIVADTVMNPHLDFWLKINTEYSKKWPNIITKGESLPDADKHNPVLNDTQGNKNKTAFFSGKPGGGE